MHVTFSYFNKFLYEQAFFFFLLNLLIFFFLRGTPSAMLRFLFLTYAQESLLTMLRGPYGMLWIEFGLPMYKASIFPAVPSLWPCICYFCELNSLLA